jgi:hypothetical protein
MRCSLYRVDAEALVAALTQPDLIARYQQRLADELPSCADRALITYLRQLDAVANKVRTTGFDSVAAQDPAAADALLSDLFAVATYDRWDVPAEHIGDDELPVDGLPRGILAADGSREGAKVFVLDEQTIAIARERTAGEVAG